MGAIDWAADENKGFGIVTAALAPPPPGTNTTPSVQNVAGLFWLSYSIDIWSALEVLPADVSLGSSRVIKPPLAGLESINLLNDSLLNPEPCNLCAAVPV
tara:strand:+ start:241 stop:540 length:300 start_codon:yes stop_codon:yes gene_type:complete